MRNPLYLVHEGKATYPDVAAFQAFFADAYEVAIVRPDELAGRPDLGRAVCWHMMGFYPRRPPAKLVIHDYRSLSVGRFGRAKDLVKRAFNARPHLRIFQNDEIRSALGFAVDAHTFNLPMGVPDFFVDHTRAQQSPACDFVYIGSLLDERRCELMLDSFLRRFGSGKLFCLYGPRNPALEARYRAHPNIRFCGMIPQTELLGVLQRARVGVAYFPNHFPHLVQTPTKLMEYAALGMRILANEQPQNRAAARRYAVGCRWGPADDMFRDVPEALDWPDNMRLDAEPMRWSSVIQQSGVPRAIVEALG